ncbi:helix-turn-helix domain-containing protein [Nonomuraea sp. NPDC050328]|uniref:helix-turn-helix domain-containing protein n=1 Tax=Nonomuraea sp. NPDC050328 TaxID=3364361 RepID=UPI00378A00AC
MPREQISPTVRRLRLGQELKLLRERQMINAKTLAAALKWSASKVSRIEAAKNLPSPEDIMAFGAYLGLDQEKVDELLVLLKEADRRGWWESYENALAAELITLLGLEAEAVAHRVWGPQIVHGLLQTEDYARELILEGSGVARITHSVIQMRLDVRLKRQEELLNRSAPPEISVVLDESVLLRRLGEPSVMRDQLGHLLDMSALDHVSVQILPLANGSQPVQTGEFTHLKFVDLDDAVYLESLYGGRFVDDLQLVPNYEAAFERLRAVALPEDESRILIQRTLSHWR